MMGKKFNQFNPGESGMASAQVQPAGSAFSKKQIMMSISAIYVGYFVYSYFMQTLNAATPKIAADLKGMQQISWSVSIPSLGLAIGTLLGGKLSDIFGRRALLLGSMIITLLGALLCGMSSTFIAFIAARTVLYTGMGILAPLCYTVIGDLFMGAADRGKWIGLLNIPMGIPALLGQPLGGWFAENWGWRHIFWWALPLAIICLVVIYGMPALKQGAANKIDVLGAISIILASSALIFGISLAGTIYPWGSLEVFGILGFAAILGALFLKAESRAKEPFLDLSLLKNRAFMTASIAGFLSFFGMMSMTLYLQLLLQGIRDISATDSGFIATPFSFLMAFVGVPTGFLIARTKRYKFVLIMGYAMVTAVMTGMVFFNQNTPIYLAWSATTLAGLGLGVIPTINTLLIQAAVPRRLMGSAMAVLFFSISIGMSMAPAVQGSAMNIQYNSALKTLLPEALTNAADKDAVLRLANPDILLKKEAADKLRTAIIKMSNGSPELFEQTRNAIRSSSEVGLRMTFRIAAITMFLAFLLILTIPVIPMDMGVAEKKKPETVAV
jgi:MFS family permease